MAGGDNVVSVVKRFVAFILLAALVGCSKPPQTPAAEAPQSTGLESIPMPDPAKYPPLSDMRGWKNPYLVVREDGIGIVDLSNREIRMLQPEEIPAELVSLGTVRGRMAGRADRAGGSQRRDGADKERAAEESRSAAGTLKELDVQFREAP